jgi:ABC-2 type transport system permease protein
MTTMTTPATGVAIGGAGAASGTLVIARRTVKKFLRTPQLIVVGTVQSVLFLVIFRYVFGGAVQVRGVPYVDFLVPGFITTVVLFVGTGTAIGVAEDIEQGFDDRLRSLPIPRASVLAGRVLADTGLLAWTLGVSTAVGFAVGFRLHGTAAEGLAALGLCVVLGFTFAWLFVAIGLAAPNAQAAQGMTMLVFPLTFLSSAYVPVDSMPGWLQAFAEHQPVTVMVDAVRALALGDESDILLDHGAGYYVAAGLGWCIGLSVLFGAIATAMYGRTRGRPSQPTRTLSRMHG